MNMLGSRCPLPGHARPSVLICLLIVPAAFLTYPMFRTLSLQLHSAIMGSYVSGTHSVVFVNCPNEQIARDIASTGEEACCLCEHPTQGIFTLIKTRTSKVPILSSYIRSVHPFEIPEVFSLAMDQGDVHYLKWLEDSMEVDRVG
ncbi:protein CutA homolog isoform X2 [Cavia porcellus]|uniref:protein CutA homolog isoform X2 n=1 Tax=Cavia porcellus TaxID=10141 RepID=UPI000661BF9C|nr:protein CutA homolog isoform X2 [Cavia porcellus]